MTNKFYSKPVLIIVFFIQGLILSSCGDDSSKDTAKIITDPFQTTGTEVLTTEKQKSYEQRKLTPSGYQAILEKVKETEQEVKKQGGKFTYKSTDFDENNHKAIIKDLLIDYDLEGLVALPIANFSDTKTLEISWYDEKNTVPYYVKVSMNDVLVANETFLKSPQGKDFINFLTSLGADYKKLTNLSDLAYEFDAKTGQIAVALNEDFNKLFTLRLVTKLDGVSKQMLDILGDTKSSSQNPGMLLGMLSSVRLQEVFIKAKLEKTIDEIFAAMPPEEAEQAKKDYAESKNMSDEDLMKQLGAGYSPEQIKQYRSAWTNFLEQKNHLVISIKPEIPQAFSALFSSIMMAQHNPKIASGLIDQLKLTVSN
jgi:hypothetical protein